MSFLGRSEINPDNIYHQPQAAKQLDMMLRALQDVSYCVVLHVPKLHISEKTLNLKCTFTVQ